MNLMNITTMSSLEVAELTGKNHGHVMRDIRVLLVQLAGMNPDISQSTYIAGNGQTYTMYVLGRDASVALIMGYDPAPRMAVIQFWREVDAHAAQLLAAAKMVDLRNDYHKWQPIPTITTAALLGRSGANSSVNDRMVKLERTGIIEKVVCITPSGVKEVWKVTTIGHTFGRNIADENDPHTTHPEWFVDSALEILKVLTS